MAPGINFYNFLSCSTCRTLDVATGGTIMEKKLKKTSELLEEMTKNSYQQPTERQPVKRIVRAHIIDPINALAT